MNPDKNPFPRIEVLPHTVERAIDFTQTVAHFVGDIILNRHSIPPENTGATVSLDEALKAQPIPEDQWG